MRKMLTMTFITNQFSRRGEDDDFHRKYYEWNQFRELIRKKNLVTFEDYIGVFLNHFKEKYQSYFLEFCMLCKENGFYFTSCEVRDATTDHFIKYGFKQAKRNQKRMKSKEIQGQKNILVGKEFEKFMFKYFERMGYQVFTTKSSHDFGADLFLMRHGEKTVVQVKCQKKNVGISAIQQVVASKRHYGCQKALVVITSRFTKPAKELAFSNFVDLWDREILSEMLIRC